MFRRTRRQLVLLNSIVFFVILCLFGTTIYFYTAYRVYNQADHTLMETAAEMNNESFRDIYHRGDPDHSRDLRITYLFWGSNGQLLGQFPVNQPVSFTQQMHQSISNERIISTTILGHVYHVYSLPLKSDAIIMGGAPVQTVEAIYDMESEQHLLHSLLMVIEVGAIVSIGIAMLVGFYLANRALIPIQKSWLQQQRFIGDASHELRTPLSVMQIHLERLFRHPYHTIEEESESISAILKENTRMRKLVTELLTLASADSNQVQTARHLISLDAVVQSVLEQFTPLAEPKMIPLTAAIQDEVQIHADEARIRQLLGILLDNAIKYTEPQGTIEVRCSKHGNTAVLEVSDAGVGIPESDLPYVFDRFYRADKARTRTKEGWGLGLSIAQWIVSEHHGRIRVDSKVGIGTTVRIQLPQKG